MKITVTVPTTETKEIEIELGFYQSATKCIFAKVGETHTTLMTNWGPNNADIRCFKNEHFVKGYLNSDDFKFEPCSETEWLEALHKVLDILNAV